MSIDAMQTPAHAKPARRDHLWVLAVIAACCLVKVWPSWVGIGAEAGFPKLGKMATDWTLAVVIEAYWAYAVYAWLAAEGCRSRRFAMWSAAAVFVLSVVGQSAAPVMAATVVKVFANALPVVVLALIAVLVHLRHLDRAEAAEADERSAVQAEMDALRAGRDTAVSELAAVRTELAGASAKVETLTRKLDARKPKSARAKTANGSRRTAANAPAKRTANERPGALANGPANAPAAMEVPEDVDARTEAFGIWLGNPKISGKDLGAAVGLGPRWGQLRKNEFAAAAPSGGEGN